jgi:hypothetical protein
MPSPLKVTVARAPRAFDRAATPAECWSLLFEYQFQL